MALSYISGRSGTLLDNICFHFAKLPPVSIALSDVKTLSIDDYSEHSLLELAGVDLENSTDKVQTIVEPSPTYQLTNSSSIIVGNMDSNAVSVGVKGTIGKEDKKRRKIYSRIHVFSNQS